MINNQSKKITVFAKLFFFNVFQRWNNREKYNVLWEGYHGHQDSVAQDIICSYLNLFFLAHFLIEIGSMFIKVFIFCAYQLLKYLKKRMIFIIFF